MILDTHQPFGQLGCSLLSLQDPGYIDIYWWFIVIQIGLSADKDVEISRLCFNIVPNINNFDTTNANYRLINLNFGYEVPVTDQNIPMHYSVQPKQRTKSFGIGGGRGGSPHDEVV